MNETSLTMAGNLVTDPELRYTLTGGAVVNLRIASTERFKGEGGWQDGDTLFMTVTAWGALAENVAKSASKGTRVIVTGRLKQRSYDTREGGRATVYKLDAADVGISLQRTTAKLVKAERQGGDNGGKPERVCTRCGERHERYGPAGLVAGLAAVLGAVPGGGLLIGLVGVPGDLAGVTSPGAVLARDRQVAVLIMLVAGLAAGLVVGLTARPMIGLGAGLAVGLAFGFAFGLVLAILQTAWPSYMLTRGWLAFHHQLPWSLMSFLADAHQRGVLRQAGAVYQFRHIELQHRLATRPSNPTSVS
jgi:single-strand DNA-binding protein